ncbi:MAG TPA: hypothetical protein VK157_10195 [Phycisphaerales bacterium]|nr:hypothetical protein [Phycisphaerales bacterium]
MQLRLAPVASLVFASSAFAQCFPQPLIQNGGFELPVIADNSTQANVTPTGWTWTPVVGGFLFRGAVGPIWPLAPQESQYLDIGNTNSYALRQVFTVPHRQVVHIQWRASAAAGAVTSPYFMRVLRASDGSPYYSIFGDAAGPYPLGDFWQTVISNYDFDPGQYIVEFQAQGLPNGFDTLIDDVRFDALPEPYILFGSSAGSGTPGDSTTMSVRISGAPPITPEWQRRVGGATGTWTPLTDGFVPGLGTVSGASTDTLHLSDLVPAGGYQEFRCIATNACGESPYLLGFALNVPQCDSIDFNRNNVFPEDQDVIDFFNVLAGADCPTCRDIDFNNNGVFPEDQDVIDFFNTLAGGACG